LIELKDIEKIYQRGSASVPVLRKIDLLVEKGDFVAVTGPSGSGKSTLLHIMGCLCLPTAGVYRLDGTDVSAASDRQLSRFRARHIGFVFQTFNLIPELNVSENAAIPFLYADTDRKKARTRVRQAVEQVGLSHRINHRPWELSGGEMQRVAIARALVMKPKLILADEPTGNLDSETGRDILELFVNLRAGGATIVMITHDREVASRARRIVSLRDGQIIHTQRS